MESKAGEKMPDELIDPEVTKLLLREAEERSKVQAKIAEDKSVADRTVLEKQALTPAVESAFREICSRLETIVVQLKAESSDQHSQTRLERQGDYIANLYLHGRICTIKQKCFNDKNDGSNPGIVLFFTDHQYAEFWGQLKGDTFSWNKARERGLLLKRKDQYSSNDIVQSIISLFS